MATSSLSSTSHTIVNVHSLKKFRTDESISGTLEVAFRCACSHGYALTKLELTYPLFVAFLREARFLQNEPKEDDKPFLLGSVVTVGGRSPVVIKPPRLETSSKSASISSRQVKWPTPPFGKPASRSGISSEGGASVVSSTRSSRESGRTKHGARAFPSLALVTTPLWIQPSTQARNQFPGQFGPFAIRMSDCEPLFIVAKEITLLPSSSSLSGGPTGQMSSKVGSLTSRTDTYSGALVPLSMQEIISTGGNTGGLSARRSTVGTGLRSARANSTFGGNLTASPQLGPSVTPRGGGGGGGGMPQLGGSSKGNSPSSKAEAVASAAMAAEAAASKSTSGFLDFERFLSTLLLIAAQTIEFSHLGVQACMLIAVAIPTFFLSFS